MSGFSGVFGQNGKKPLIFERITQMGIDELLEESHRRWADIVKEHAGSNYELAKFLGVAESTVRRWNSPDFETSAPTEALVRCCMEWDISPTWLYWGLGPKRLSQIEALDELAALLEEVDSLSVRVQAAVRKLGLE